MRFIVVINNSMVLSGTMENGQPLFTPITLKTVPLSFDTAEEAKVMATRAGRNAQIWTEQEYDGGHGVLKTWPRAGEVRDDGTRRVCINPHAEYGGGGGPLWAVEGREAQLTTHDSSGGYMRGVCEEIYDDGTHVVFRITQGATEGRYMMGKTVVIPINIIGRYDTAFW